MKGIAPAWNKVHSDFANYYVSAKLVVDGNPLDKLYDNEWFQHKIMEYGIGTLGKFSPFPPVTCWIMLPLTFVDTLTAQRIFMFINLIFILIGIVLIKKITAWEPIHCAILILGGGFSVVNNIAFGQIYWVMTVFMLFFLMLVKKGYPILAGFIIGIFISLKYFPIVFVAGFLLARLTERRLNPISFTSFFSTDVTVAISSLITLLIIIYAEFSFFGSFVMNQFIHSAFLPHLDGRLTGQGLYSFQFQSWDNLFRNMFVRSEEFNPFPLIDWAVGRTVLKTVVMLIVTGLMFFVLYHYKDAEVRVRRAVCLAVPTLTALVILPASATYHFALLIIPLAIIIGEHLVERKFIAICIALYGMIGFIPYGLAFQLGRSWGLLFAYPRLWLVSTLYIVIIFGLIKRKELTFAA